MEIIPSDNFEERHDQEVDVALHESQQNSSEKQESQVEPSDESVPIRVSAFGPDIYGNF